jgi:hypothetical protein
MVRSAVLFGEPGRLEHGNFQGRRRWTQSKGAMVVVREDSPTSQVEIQPLQNPLALGAFLGSAAERQFRILDTSPMVLSRADATFDGLHFRLPGPVDFWSRMLCYQMERKRK